MAIAGCILAVAGLAGYFTPPPTEAFPTRILMQNAGGRIVFTHRDHSETPNMTCAACHHELRVTAAGVSQAGPGPASGPGEVAARPAVMACADCHGAGDNPRFAAEHQKTYAAKGVPCASCHHARIEGLAPGWDHAVHAEQYAAEDCTSCHHPASFSYKEGRIMAHKPQKCSNCHTAKPNKLAPTTLKDAAHARCVTCHEELFDRKAKGCPTCHNVASAARAVPGKAGPSGKSAESSCASCHAPLLSRMDAFHKSCMGCHDKMAAAPGPDAKAGGTVAITGPGAKAPCAQCHTP